MTDRQRPSTQRPSQVKAAQTFFSQTDLSELLFAYGDNPPSLPTTLSILDSILVSFITETCHVAALSASYSRRQKIKIDDFKFVLRHDEYLLGRVLEQMFKDQRIQQEKKGVDLDIYAREGMGAGLGALGDVADVGGVTSELKRGRGRGGRRKRKSGEDGEGEGGSRKRVKSED
ncbi:hypothetical protein LTR62_002112 [Meristemomyces frigidus]|uniref:Transcription initiation factor TFIID subunit 13 n=1 Tax=Meristemomyces frigidus TaxID=1508187 RepID=A0AAN7YM43_9PEZI|nr:hypothetical protein LTR62_002112 [Meristemomyces frigidus]